MCPSSLAFVCSHPPRVSSPHATAIRSPSASTPSAISARVTCLTTTASTALDWRTPKSTTFTNITGFPEGNSLMHVSLITSSVMMQGALHRVDPGTGARQVVAPLLANMVRAQLQANVTYQLELSVARAGESGANCVTLPVQWSIAPMVLWPLASKCPTGALDHLPTMEPPRRGLFSEFDRWNYSSVAINESLYVQQNFDAPRTFEYTFTLDSLGRVYAAVGFDLQPASLTLPSSARAVWCS